MARTFANQALQFNEPLNSHSVHALLGVVMLRQKDMVLAKKMFTDAIAQADQLLSQTPEFLAALDAKGVALCGLHLCRGAVAAPANTGDETSPLQNAVDTFRAARKINKDKGIVARVVRLLDALALAHPNGAELLAEARKASGGD